MIDRLDWERDSRDWPNRDASRFVVAAGFRWHVQVMGQGPVVLLLHGTGAATHSWRDLAPLLARHFTVVAPDLPGHGFTGMPAQRRLSLPGMAVDTAALLQVLEVSPALAVGHSAGAALAARMILHKRIAPRGLISLNGALLPLHGMPSQLFSPIAKLLASTSLTSRLFSWGAGDRASVERLLRATGSHLDPTGVALYERLVRNPGHVAGALGMMANWDLSALERELPSLDLPVLLVAGENDHTIPPTEAQRVRVVVPTATVAPVAALGHLAHEERPQDIAALITEFARSVQVLPPS